MKPALRWKICGLRESSNIAEVALLRPDWMGFIFYQKSPRYVGDDFQLPELKTPPQKMGVFVNDSYDRITALRARHGLQGVQLHGEETPDECARLRSPHTVLVKAVGVGSQRDIASLAPFRAVVDFFLFDTKTSQRGGSGRTFNWEILKAYDLDIPFLLSGGLTLHNLEEALSIEHPQFAGVDLNSGLETSPGHKDIEKVIVAKQIITTHQPS
ncbi:MAG: phosphoribosylanthranilate isomerase [Cyclobacteriaceae bacterium]|jgi:phosphoribosylanthranilate isomerase|nr:phosphoribosylanthranilate isomerase [Cyclobacteriaceae bacterium]